MPAVVFDEPGFRCYLGQPFGVGKRYLSVSAAVYDQHGMGVILKDRLVVELISYEKTRQKELVRKRGRPGKR